MPTDSMADERAEVRLDQELAGLDHLEAAAVARPPLALRLWVSAWPKLAAVGLVIAVWQFAVWREWKPRFVLPAPVHVWHTLWSDLGTSDLWRAVAHTMRRAVIGFAVSLLVGGLLGLAVSRSRVLRVAVGSMITGFQTMPSIAWFPLAILLFKLSEQAILFVVVLGAAPSIANGIIAGVDSVPPLLRRVGLTLGARNVAMYRDFVIPAAMPTVLSGLKQGWAFSWRSLMAGELLVIIPGTASLGQRLQFAREFSNAKSLIATMVVVLVIGILVDGLVFGQIERRVLARRGLARAAT
jgi:NitT/TauT family transport system permease protein